MSGTQIKAPRLLHQIRGLSFPDYVFQEYPKWVTKADGTKMVVNSKGEEEAALERHDKPAHEVLGTAAAPHVEEPAVSAKPNVVFKPAAPAKAAAEDLAKAPGAIPPSATK